MSILTALVQPTQTFPSLQQRPEDRRRGDRQASSRETIARPVDSPEALAWGATVNDVSPGGIGLTLCFPFKMGTLLTIELKKGSATLYSTTAQVVHVHDKSDGTWHVGCQFMRPLSAGDLNKLV